MFPWYLIFLEMVFISASCTMSRTSVHSSSGTDDAVKVLYSICQQTGKLSSAVAGLEKVRFHSSPKECSSYGTIAFMSHTGKVILKILQARLQQYVNRELPDVQAGFRKGRGTRDKIANICWVRKAREFQKNTYFCFIDYAKAFDCVDHNKLWTILKEMGLLDHLTCLLRWSRNNS